MTLCRRFSCVMSRSLPRCAFYTMQPDAMIEAVRIQASHEQLKKIVKLLSKNLNYYPEKDPTD